MKRLFIIVVIFLLAGAVVNLAVACGCRLAFRAVLAGQAPRAYTLAYQPSNASTTAWWNEKKPEGITDELAGFASSDHFGWSHVVLRGDAGGKLRILPSGHHRISGPLQDFQLAMYLTAGLPMRSLHGQSWFQKGVMIQQSGIPTTGLLGGLPYVPIWPGFAVNTLFYAVVLWLLICGPFAMRRRDRVRRGLCPKCAYPMGESGVCSECGRLLPTRGVSFRSTP